MKVEGIYSYYNALIVCMSVLCELYEAVTK